MSSNKQSISIKGMHCKSCAVLIEDKIKELPEVQNVRVNFHRRTAEISSSTNLNSESIAQKIREAGYDVGEDTKRPWLSRNFGNYQDLAISFLILGAIYLLAQITGLTQLLRFAGSGDPSGLVVVGILGLTAGFSTCMALVGGLLLGLSARHGEKHLTATPLQKFRPHLYFNLGRLISYSLLGGMIGLVGKVFQMTGGLLGLLTILVGFVMFMLGLQLVEIFPRLSGFSFSLPQSLSRIFGLKQQEKKEYSHGRSLLVGALTFFLPCGFTQAMQLFAMGSGSFISGAMIMGIFALGTTPGLLSLGGLTSVVKGAFAKKFYRFVGVVVIVFGFITISNGYNLSGWKTIVSNWSPAVPVNQPGKDYQGFFNSLGRNKPDPKIDDSLTSATLVDGVQVIKTTYLSLGEDISPANFSVKSGQPVRMEVTVLENGQGCMSTIMIPGLYNKPIYLQKDQAIVMEFTPQKTGTYDIACAMGVVRGKIIVQ